MMAHLRPHISNLKAAFVFPRSTFSRLLYDITARRPRAGASSPFVGSNSTIIHFPHYLFIITQSNKCAVCSVMLHHTSDNVTWVSALPTAKVTIASFPFHLLLPRELEYFSSLSVGNSLWQSNNLFHVPFERLPMPLLKEATKVYKPQGLRRGFFDPAGRHWQVCFSLNSRLFFPLWRLYVRLWEDSFLAHI